MNDQQRTDRFIVALNDLNAYRGTDADQAWRRYLQACEERAKEQMIESDLRDQHAAGIRFLRELLKDLDIVSRGGDQE